MPTSTPSSSRSREGRPLARGELAAYGSGIIAHQYPHVALAQLAMPLFNIGLGLGSALVGGILMIGRIWDAASNPIFGVMSDNTRSRWGRRRPFILAGGLLCGLAYPLVWLPSRGWSSGATAAYLLCSTLLLYTAFSAYSVTYVALGLELTPDYHEKTRVQVWRSYFALVPVFTGGWFYWVCQRPIFPDVAVGARWLGAAVGIVIMATSAIPALFLREPYYRTAVRARKEPMLRSLREVFSNRPFAIISIVIVALELGRFTTDNLGFYVLSYHVFGGNLKAAGFLLGINTTAVIASAFIAIPCVHRLAARWGKIQALRACLLINIAADLLKWVLASPAHPWTWIIINLLTQFGGLGFWILVNSMKADVCDWDELVSGRRREGSFSAVSGLLQKSTAALTLFLAGLILSWIGFSPDKGGGQGPGTIFWLRLAYSVPSVCLLGTALWVLRRYRLDERAMLSVRARLERRRAPILL